MYFGHKNVETRQKILHELAIFLKYHMFLSWNNFIDIDFNFNEQKYNRPKISTF